jgi:hypothetical protein
MLKTWITAGTASLALLIAAPIVASAAPAAGATTAMKAALPQTSAVESVANRRCWWQDGVRRCSRAVEFEYGRPRPEVFPTGSTAWWRAMDYEGRGGHGRSTR